MNLEENNQQEEVKTDNTNIDENYDFEANRIIDEEKLVREAADTALTDEEKFIASLPSNNVAPSATIGTNFEKDNNMTPMLVNSVYNTDTGMSTPLIGDGEVDINALGSDDIDTDALIDSMINGNSVSLGGLRKTINRMKIDNVSGEDIKALCVIVNDHLNQKISDNYYEILPDSIKIEIENQLIKSRGRGSAKSITNQIRKVAAYEIIDKMATDYVTRDMTVDMDSVMVQINAANKELNDEISKLTVGSHVSLVSKNIEQLKNQKNVFIERGEIDKANELQEKIIDVMEDTIHLTSFKEFCKKVRIKNYELERPEKVFHSFNQKYYSHRLNINDISKCPETLIRHFTDHIKDDKCLKVCIAFCKYCLNYSPDVPKEHTFMYYFIKNILIMNLIYPNGYTIAAPSSEEAAKFYLDFKKSIESCMDNLK